jgi:hypothetical protein
VARPRSARPDLPGSRRRAGGTPRTPRRSGAPTIVNPAWPRPSP